MTDTLNKFGETLVTNLTNAAWTDLIIYGIGFIGFCILGALITRKDRKKNPEKYARMSAAYNQGYNQGQSTGTVIIDGQAHTVYRAGNTTYIS